MPDNNIVGVSTPPVWAQWTSEQSSNNSPSTDDSWKKTNIWDAAAAMQAGAYMS